jgi:hypothetical protein
MFARTNFDTLYVQIHLEAPKIATYLSVIKLSIHMGLVCLVIVLCHFKNFELLTHV